MFANAFRRHVQTALVASLRRTAAPSLAARVARPSTLCLRSLSTTLVRLEAGGMPRMSNHEPSLQLFIGNIPWQLTDAELHSMFSQHGEVASARVIMNADGSSRGFGYVVFKTQEGATNAFNQDHVVGDRQLRVDYTALQQSRAPRTPSTPRSSTNSPSNVLWVGNIPYGAEEQDLRSKFEPFGSLRSVRIAMGPNGEARGFAHVEFMREQDAVTALEDLREEPMFMMDRNLRVDFAPQRKQAPAMPVNRIYFHDFRGSEEDLRNVLQEWGNNVIKVTFLRDHNTGSRLGNGFIQFTTTDVATKVKESLDGQTSQYGPLNFEFAKSTRPNASPVGKAQGYAGQQNRQFGLEY
ncbi:unnamed protein product [Mycena citricolor]|uniref:RRM domain-containing protein n=1 Tax=Mycena citricolor TaxID=2018698 RepID=A0AAD2H9X0_9AGAR|nr:unnamed protein product [Mycena citricolor]